MLNKFTYSSQEAPWADTCQLFERKMAKLFAVDFNYSSVDTRPLHGNITAYHGSGLSFSSLEFSPHVASCLAPASVPSEAIFVSVQKQGQTQLRQADRECITEPGDIFLFDPTRPFTLETSHTHVYSMYLSRRALLEHVPQMSNLTAIRINGRQGTGALLRIMLDELFSVASSITPQALAPLSSIMPQLVCTALLSLEQFDEAGPSKMQVYHKSKIRSYIEANLADPSLSAKTIAQGVGLSTRYIYQLFDDEPLSLMKWIWSKRLEQCRLQIASPAFRNKTISEIAYAWGFSDVAHFSRVFKATYGQPPSKSRPTL